MADTLAEFRKELGDKLSEKFGITIGDCIDESQIEVEFADGSTVEGLVDYLGDKYDLTPKSELI